MAAVLALSANRVQRMPVIKDARAAETLVLRVYVHMRWEQACDYYSELDYSTECCVGPQTDTSRTFRGARPPDC